VKVRLVVVGKPRTRGLSEAVEDFERRASRYWPLEIREVRETSGRSRSPDQVRAEEWKRLAEAAAGCLVVLCDRSGEMMTSERFSAWLEARRHDGTDVAFVIGGAHGLPPGAAGAASRVLALSGWTMPHELARLVLVEQLYRAGTILRGEPYHK
jgi:23S rRNA (pseudouridine1915-N3)-methyltransferase